MKTYFKAWRSFVRGADGLTPQDQIDRNLVVITGNLFVIAAALVCTIVMRLWSLFRG